MQDLPPTVGFRSVARPSRPPGFDMTYRPTEEAFGPPLVVWLPTLLYVVIATAAVVLVIVGEASPYGSLLHTYVVEGNALRFISARTFAAVLALSAVAAVLKTSMRGVRVRGDGIEYRDVVSLLWPQVRRYQWAQIDRLQLGRAGAVAIELWDGSMAVLPPVAQHERLVTSLERVAIARAIPVSGGRGLDEIPEPEDYDSESA